ncbi:inositol monophosphatase family protein [Marinoscillum sp. MHG1-6]|uniref:inositol monophosphatase family protein n=1 Tax=Marinoscillum sp. MHG1-6 TaxID=2959627 RepID=UPI0021570C2F|nr:inositol monophosphatase family protein [Marinoscillum sp. MHG1-6]
MKLDVLTHEVIEVAKEAGAFIRRESENFSLQDVEEKGKSDLVSYVDKETEKMLVEQLERILPEAGFITEEDTPNQLGKEYTWIIDPLDGTTNFIHGLPTYAVSIGLMQNQKMVSGVIYEINHDEVFYAWKGGGAFMNGKPIHVTKVEKIEDSLFATGFPYYQFHKLEEYMAILNELMKNCHGLRRIGSAATDMAYVACGRCEGFFEYNLNSYDIAAGVIIVQEAGGTITDFQGGDNYLFGRELVAAGPVHAEFLKVIQKYW